MRTITIPQHVIDAAAGQPTGAHLECAVEVMWPELQLTEDQQFANACAMAADQPAPYPDHRIFIVRLPYATPKVEA